ncbi:Protein CPR-5, partial [Mucuna pruriens]
MAEIENYSAISECESKVSMENRPQSSEASETTSSSSSQKGKGKGKGVAFRRRNPRVLVRRNKANNVDTIGLPLGMSFAAIMAQVLYRKDTAAESMSPDHLSMMCSSAIKESVASVFGDKLDGLTRNFEQSFSSTLSTLWLIYESSTSNEGNKLNNKKMKIPSSKLTLDKGECSGDIVTEDGHSRPSHAEIQDQSISCDASAEVRGNFHMDSISCGSPEEGRDNFHMDSTSRDLTLYEPSNQMVPFSQISFGSVNNPMVSIFEKSIVEQCRSNDLKILELGLKMKELKLKEDELALNHDSNNLNRSKLAMGESKASFRAEKFKTQLEDTRHGELKKKCIDCLITGLLIMSSSLLYGAYVYSYERITGATESCTPSTQASIIFCFFLLPSCLVHESSSWWTPKSVISINSRLHILWCQVQVMSRMMFGVLMIFAVAYLLMQRSTSSQTMPVTFILLMLGVGCGYCGKLCVETLGGSGNVWLLYWEIMCFLHFLSIGWTSALHSVLHGPVIASQTTEDNTFFRYWIRRVLFYATMLVFLPLFCGLMPFASLGQWKDHFTVKVSDFDGSE